MSSLPPAAPKDDGNLGGAFEDLIAVCLAELRADLRQLWESNWGEPERRRALEIASTMKDACDRQQAADLAILLRSLASLLCIPRKEALPLKAALREKFDELLNLAFGHVVRFPKRRRQC